MTRSKHAKLPIETDPSSTISGDGEIGTDTETPRAKEPSLGEVAFGLAKKNEERVNKLEKDINNPEWTKEFLKSQLFFSNFIKLILLFFLIFLALTVSIFLACAAYQLMNLNNVFGDIRDVKALVVNEDLLNKFNELFYQTRKIINFNAIIIGGIAIISILGLFLKKLIDKLVDNLTSKK